MREGRADEAYRHLAAYIEDREEGTRLPAESEFVDRLGLSRTSIREALARLRAEGRAISRRGSGTFVSHPKNRELVRLSRIGTIDDLIEWHEFRVALESEIAALAAERRTKPELAAMHAAQKALLAKLATETGEHEDAAFHRTIATASHNRRLVEAAGALASHILKWAAVSRDRRVLMLSERREIIAVEHGDIVRAIAAGEANEARLAARRHLLNGRARLLSSLPR